MAVPHAPPLPDPSLGRVNERHRVENDELVHDAAVPLQVVCECFENNRKYILSGWYVFVMSLCV
jgi:hypothetical protein